jgi:ketosteroid isomerase-like protein
MLNLSVGLILLAAAAQTAPAAPSGPEALMQSVRAAERSGDVAALTRLTSPQFVQQHATGAIEPREAYLASLVGRAARGTPRRGFLERDVRWRQTGDTAIRTSITRIRGAKAGTDVWVRATAVVAREAGVWRLLNLDSALLYEGPTYDAPAADLPASRFASNGGGPFSLFVRSGQPYVELEHGVEIPLIPIGPDIYSEGGGSTLTIVRDKQGVVTAVTRKNGGLVAWTAAALPGGH